MKLKKKIKFILPVIVLLIFICVLLREHIKNKKIQLSEVQEIESLLRENNHKAGSIDIEKALKTKKIRVFIKRVKYELLKKYKGAKGTKLVNIRIDGRIGDIEFWFTGPSRRFLWFKKNSEISTGYGSASFFLMLEYPPIFPQKKRLFSWPEEEK